MHSGFLIAVLAGLGGMFGWGLADLFAKKTIDAIGDIVTLVIAHVFGVGFVILIALYELARGGSITVPHDLQTWVLLAFFGTLQAVIYLLVYIGFGKGQVAVLNPVFSSFTGITALISILFFAEVVSGYVLFGLFITFLGVMLLSVDLGALRERKLDFMHVPGFKEVGIATLLAAIWTLSWNAFVSGQDWLSYALFMYLFMAVALLAYAWVKQIPLRVENPSVWKYLVLIGLFETGAYVAISWGYGATPYTSVVAVLSGAFSLPTILLARAFLGERVTRLQTAAALVIVAGIAFVSVL